MSAGRATRWGWHQLADDWARQLVADARIHPGDLVLDIGAGAGALTRPLVAAGARVVAVELHPRRADLLRARFAGDAVTVVRADAADLRLPRRPFRVVANPPFAVEVALVRRLLAPGSRLESARLVLPRHAAARWASRRHHGAQRWAQTFDVYVDGDLPRRAFRPQPPAGAAVLVIERRGLSRTSSSVTVRPSGCPGGW